MIRKLRVENERKIAQEFEINQDPFTLRSKKGSGPEIMGPPWNGKHNLFTEVVDIAINFNDFFASAFRQEHVKKILAKRHVFAYIREERWNKYQARAMGKLLNRLISGKVQKKNWMWMWTWISDSIINHWNLLGAF